MQAKALDIDAFMNAEVSLAQTKSRMVSSTSHSLVVTRLNLALKTATQRQIPNVFLSSLQMKLFASMDKAEMLDQRHASEFVQLVEMYRNLVLKVKV